MHWIHCDSGTGVTLSVRSLGEVVESTVRIKHKPKYSTVRRIVPYCNPRVFSFTVTSCTGPTGGMLSCIVVCCRRAMEFTFSQRDRPSKSK